MTDLLAVGLVPVGATVLLGLDVLENFADLTPADQQAKLASWN